MLKMNFYVHIVQQEVKVVHSHSLHCMSLYTGWEPADRYIYSFISVRYSPGGKENVVHHMLLYLDTEFTRGETETSLYMYMICRYIYYNYYVIYIFLFTGRKYT